MKRIICLICTFLILFSLCSCKQNSDKLVKPVNFYYLTDPAHYLRDAVTAEIRESSPYEDDLVALIQLYLQGPQSNDMINPFPEKVLVKSIGVNNTTVDLQLSESFSQLSEIDMTAACACLTLTTLEITGRNRLVITSLDSQDNIIYTASMTKDQVLLSTNE